MAKNRILTDTQIADFHRDGFIIVRAMLAGAEFDEIARWTVESQDWPEIAGTPYMMYFETSGNDDGRRLLNRVENLYDQHAGFRALFDGDKIKGAVSDLLADKAVLYKDKINYKLPGGGGFEPHQDQQAGWSTYADYFITAMVTIDAATLENGCLELAAGQHKDGLIGEEWVPLSSEQMAAMNCVPVPTLPGDVAFFDSFCPHASGPNQSADPRRVLYVTYNRASAGDHRRQYYADKRANFPPDIERVAGKEYVYKV